jgi:hypothetical protein
MFYILYNEKSKHGKAVKVAAKLHKKISKKEEARLCSVFDILGREKEYIDYGVRDRAILAIGKQDTEIDALCPLSDDIKILGCSSDHMIVDVSDYKNDIKVGESAASDYYRELSAFWSQNYDGTNFTDLVTQDPSSLNYWLEIYPAAGKYAKYSVPAIGRRTYAVNDDNATCIYPPEVPGIVWWSEADVDFNNLDDCKTIAKNYFNGYPLAKMPAELA